MLGFNSQLKTEHQKDTGNSVKIIIARSIEEIEDIRSVWEQMQAQQFRPIPNADINRYLATVAASGDDVQPYVMLIKRDDSPVAMVIGRLEKRRVKCRIGYKELRIPQLQCLTIVYGGIIGELTADVCNELMRGLLDVRKRGEVDLIFFNHLRVDSPICELCKKLSSFLSHSHFAPVEPHWQTQVPDTVEEFYSGISSSRKRKWRYSERRLEKISSSDIKVICYKNPSDINYVMDVACRISALTYKDTLGVGFTNSTLNRSLLKQAAEDGWLRAYVLYTGDSTCAFELDIQYGNTQFAEYAGFDPQYKHGSPGIVLWVKVLEQLCQEPSVSTADYGFGHAPYKKQFGTDYWLEESVYIYAPRLYPVLINILQSSVMGLNAALEYILNKIGFVGWIKRRWRNLLQRND